MSWQSIVAGVDGSPESARAAVIASWIAARTGATCRLVAAMPDYSRILYAHGMVADVEAIARDAAEGERARLAASLLSRVPSALINHLDLRPGRAPIVLRDRAARMQASLIVVGSKQRHGLDRLHGSSIPHLLRSSDVPVLVTAGETFQVRRILVALDLSYASLETLRHARRWAAAFGAQLRAIHVIEPMPTLPEASGAFADEYYRGDEMQRTVGPWASIEAPEEKVVRSGRAASTIMREAVQWNADLLVLGSHGHGWVERLLIGSITEEIATRPPVSTLIVPVTPADDMIRTLADEARAVPGLVAAGAYDA